MPIEIRELIVKPTISEGPAPASSSMSAEEKEALIKEIDPAFCRN